MKPKVDQQKLFLLPASLYMWLVASTLVLWWLDPGTLVLALALLAFTACLAATNVLRYGGWIAAGLSIILYCLAQASLKGVTSAMILPSVALAVASLVTAWLGTWLANEVKQVIRQLNNDQKLIEELRLYEPNTGLLRYQYVHQTLKSEIVRSQRFNKNLCVLALQIDDLENLESEHGPAGMAAIRRQVAEMITGSLRAMDIPFDGDKTGAILPETNLEGAQIVVNRLLQNTASKVRVGLNVGIAEFPTDGVSDGELIQAAEAALLVSQTAGQPFVSYTQIRQQSKPEKAAEK